MSREDQLYYYTPVFWVGKLRLGEVKCLAPGLPGKRQSQDIILSGANITSGPHCSLLPCAHVCEGRRVEGWNVFAVDDICALWADLAKWGDSESPPHGIGFKGANA